MKRTVQTWVTLDCKLAKNTQKIIIIKAKHFEHRTDKVFCGAGFPSARLSGYFGLLHGTD